MEELKKGSQDLKREVMDGGWCVSCGVCVEACPYIKALGDRVAVIHDCRLDDGNCYKICPRTETDYHTLSKMVHQKDEYEPVLGGHRKLYFARAAQEKFSEPAQYGGVVTALAALALSENEVDAALLTGNSPGNRPQPVLARKEEEVVAAAGSKYTVCPTVKGLYKTNDDDRVLVVGRPCQVTGLRKLQHRTEMRQGKNVELIIGLFCFFSLRYDFYDFLQDELGIDAVCGMDIPKDGDVRVLSPSGKHEVPLDKIRPLIKQGCHSCFDPTSELSDISVGSTESDPGWCTLIVRTEKGDALVQKAIAQKVIEVQPYPAEKEKQLREAVVNKKRRVLLEQHDFAPINSSYLNMDEKMRQFLKGRGENV
ncbi:MAG: Coenzyme F420 hydrogenase/dehydrogenase, beta subunit C-terminal domain [Dethiobacter sp.]|nr:Coenzyme F420 hydrogenase/dehydrogenase, beta subunit C-terminal domain [Dethiobacter sp.]